MAIVDMALVSNAFPAGPEPLYSRIRPCRQRYRRRRRACPGLLSRWRVGASALSFPDPLLGDAPAA